MRIKSADRPLGKQLGADVGGTDSGRAARGPSRAPIRVSVQARKAMTDPSEMVNVRYMVDDVEAALAFYTQVLDFKVLTSFVPAFADVTRGNLRLLLSGPTSSAARPLPDGTKPVPGGWNRLHLIVDDIDA